MLLGRRIMCKELDEDEECQSDERAESTLKVRRRWDGVQVDNWARRYDDEARDKLEFQHCSYLQVMGMFTLWVGWYGFNAGSVLGASHHHEHAAALVSWNTTLAASAAGLGACLYLYGFHLNLDVGFLCNGVLSGMVAITAPCDVTSPAASAVIGLLSGLLVYPACSRAMRWAKLDDPVDAVSVHAGSGLLGVLATAFCTPDCDVLQSGHIQRQVQLEHIVPAWLTAVPFRYFHFLLVTMSHGDIETAVGQRDDSPDVSGEASPPARTSTDRKLAFMNPFSKFTCCLISAGLLLPFTVSIPGFESFRKEVIGASCMMIFLGTLVRMRLQRCRCEVMKAEDSLSAAEHDFHYMQIQSQDPRQAPTKKVLDKASVLDPAPAKGMNEQGTCLCCLEDFEDSSVVALLPCGHIFHEECIMAWGIAKRRASTGCPVCRQSFLVV
eukprot:s374_g11.t1